MIITPALLKAFEDAPGFDPDGFCRIHESGQQVSSVRFNPAKIKELEDAAVELESRVPWTKNGWYLTHRPVYTFDPLLHAGAYYVQDASSMFLEQALQQAAELSAPLRVLDLCAAPGGKSTHIQSLLSPQSVLVSNEVIRSRAAILEENCIKWGGGNVIVTNNDPRDFSSLPGLFDVMVVDAPCSGSGMFRRDPSAAENWSPDLVNLCSQRQQRILADAWPSLKEDGILVYATCSYSVEEDEAIADWILNTLNATSVTLHLNPEWNIVTSLSAQGKAACYRFYPDKLKGEGFFLAVFRKTTPAGSINRISGRPKWDEVPKKEHSLLQRWLADTGMRYITVNGSVLAMHPNTENLLLHLRSLYIRYAGVLMGKLSAKDLVPEHALALSGKLSASIPSAPLNKEQALAYLRKEDWSLPSLTPGWNLASYKSYPLGWIKVLPNRINNYYPKEWRILKLA